MRDYLTFESEFDRLKGLFLLEGADDDLSEGSSNENDDETEGKTEDEKSDADSEGSDDSLDGEESKVDDLGDLGDDADLGDDDIDLDGDSDLGDITGNPDDAPDAGDVNAENAPPGAINPMTLLQEMSTGEDNIYTRVIQNAKEKFPGGTCKIKDLMVPIAHSVKAFMKNKNYAPISKEAMKAICLKVASVIKQKCGEQQKSQEAHNASTGTQNAVESVIYFKKAPYLESQELMEGWKELLLAGALGASSAMAATAQSAPATSLHGTPHYDNQETTFMASVPSTSNPEKVQFNPNATYDMTQDEFATYKAAGNLPDHYIVSDGNAKTKVKTGQVKQGGNSQTQKAVKNQAKSGKTTKKIAKTGADSDDEICHARDAGAPTDLRRAAHDLGHKAVDAGSELGHKAVDKGIQLLGAGKEGVKGFLSGWTKGWNKSEIQNEREHEGL